LFTHYQQQENHREGQESRHFAQALQDTDFNPGKARLLNHEIINQRLPASETERHRRREQVKKCFGFLQMLF